jgi:chemotaxis protein CheX
MTVKAQDFLSEALIDGAREVFETMMFMTVEPADQNDEIIESETLLGSITFKGSLEGVLKICCGKQAAEMVAINMLGMEPDEKITEEEVADAVGEVANMVMGTVKARIIDHVGDLQVSIPQVIRGNALGSRLGEGYKDIKMVVNLDDAFALLGITYREPEN